MPENPVLTWTEPDDGSPRSARWLSASGAPAPRRVEPGDDRMPAAVAYKLACEGTAVLWRGDYHGARQVLAALGRRLDKRPSRRRKGDGGADPAADFHRQRQEQGHRARILGMLLIPLEPGYVIPLRRAPEVAEACAAAYGPYPGDGDGDGPAAVSLRDLLGVLGAYQWQQRGVEVPALGGARIHPSYGVFAPVRGEYVDLVAEAPLPPGADRLAFDVGTGTGVLAAVLARRGVRRVVATDVNERALACARTNADRLGHGDQVEVVSADLFPDGRAPLAVCNPPWLPAKPTSTLEYAVYDPGSRMLRGFLDGLADHLEPGGEGWLIVSDLAEHLGLRSRAELLGWIEAAGLTVAGRLDTRPRHPRAADPDDPLHAARGAEVTSLWRLRAA
ncbi:methyltransferase [Streptomyces boninensis]|uniref:methyltransferase n=1 Tax=Streptomyces boninensis TaxID=2039455 RepID=UPI003B227153